VSITINPFQYNPVRGELTVTESMTVTVTMTRGAAGPAAGLMPSKPSAMFRGMYASHFVNYAPAAPSRATIMDGEAMMVITVPALAEAVQPLVDWKNTMGIATKRYVYPAETGGPGPQQIRAFIKERCIADNITYILLVGDAQDIPPDSSYYGVSDPQYTKIAGQDDYGDALIGRFSVSTPEQAAVVVAKNIWYERDPDSNGSWYGKAFGIGSDESGDTGGLKDWERLELLRPILTAYSYTVFDSIYHYTARADQISVAVNEGRGLGLYIGHGTDFIWETTYFGVGNVAALTNVRKTPVIISVACTNGYFMDTMTCFAEAWQRKGTVTDPAGSIIFCGATIEQPWEPPCVALENTITLLAEEASLSFGAMFVNGQFAMMAADPAAVEVYDTWLLFGDPSLILHTGKPKTITVTGPQLIDTGFMNLPIAFSAGITGRVGISGAVNGYIASAIVSDTAQVVVPVTVPDNETHVTVTVTGRNSMPVTKKYTVGQSGIVSRHTVPEHKAVQLGQMGRFLMVRTATAEKHTVTLWRVNGRKVASYTVGVPDVWQTFPLPTGAGMCLVTIATKNNSKVIKRFTVP
jgi:gingipain R